MMIATKNDLSKQTFILSLSVLGLFFFSHELLAKQKTSRSPLVNEIKLQFVSEPQDGEVCFSPDEPCDLKLIKLVQSAKKSIDISIFDINRDQLVHEIIVASKKIPVRIVADRRQGKGQHSLVPLLLKAGVPLKFGRQRGIMHNKFTLVDDRMVETGSFNYTNHAAEANNENQIYLTNPKVIERYKKRFADLWEKGFVPKEETASQ